MKSLTGKVAIVTGASQGIGAAIARQLATDGAKVVVNYNRSQSAAEEVVSQIQNAGGEAIAVHSDVSEPFQIPPLFTKVIQKYGQLDILINNAGVIDNRPVEEINAEMIDRLFAINVRGMLLCSHEAVKYFGERGGKIINISSNVTKFSVPTTSVYSATKGAVNALTKVLAAELGPRGITVNAVAPGSTDTELLKVGVSEEVRQQLPQNTPLRRLGTPEDIAQVVAFFVSDNAHWVTGEVLYASGGQ
ncbi:glucose 1-dehydrogenase (plasmid) [Nostoc edaphicum CCNP1411]|uniref:Glucose 1-dehydrogenase n=1 Tax=Nostoc edaphicum CCNP1411 TaxID=1472755 RepID=A0A7D7L852_9NOSO|nr:glucose 1-dehydrogenase [Nostoc edaphicum]QMS86236.1 glucose 1-dehydrogenase [Nostoc edaphicum CCNP1411]